MAPEDFYPFFQAVLAMNSFVCTEVGPQGATFIQIDRIDEDEPGARRSHAAFVDPEGLEVYADQPKILITTILSLPNSNVTQVAQAMRATVSSSAILQIESAGETGALVITGWGDKVAALAALLKTADEASLFD